MKASGGDARSRPGAPLRALAVLMLLWVGARSVFEYPWGGEDFAVAVEPASRNRVPDPAPQMVQSVARTRASYARPTPVPLLSSSGVGGRPFVRGRAGALPPFAATMASPVSAPPAAPAATQQRSNNVLRPVFAAGTSVRTTRSFDLEPPPRANRWRAYAYLFARGGSGRSGRLLAPQASYGGSQAAAIVERDLGGGVAGYARASTSLGRTGEEELALGVRAAPFADLPISLHLEQRVADVDDPRTSTAAFVSGGGAVDLPARLRVEGYGQAGYALGDFDSHFYDAAARLTRPVATPGRARISVGAGAWAGGQRGVDRIDVGPTVVATVPVGEVNVRVGADWRQRVAGNADPGSGPAVTLSVGF